MSFQFMTIDMVQEANNNGGFIDQSNFKTSEQFHFDTLVLSQDVLDILNSYITHIRPLQYPKCDFAVVSTAGTQFTAMGNALSLLVLQAIGKYYINPTRYRQIAETESSNRLTPRERETISKDLKHSSHVAKRSYQKSLSREVAIAGSVCMQKLIGEDREAHTSALASEIRGLQEGESDSEEVDEKSENVSVPAKVICVEDCTVSLSTFDEKEHTPGQECIDEKGLEVKKEELDTEGEKKKLSFTAEEDKFLRLGYVKYSKCPSKWAKILKDSAYSFQDGRTRDSLRVRATTLKISKKKK